MKRIALITVSALLCIFAGARENVAPKQPASRLKPNSTVLLYPKGQSVDEGVVLGPLESNGETRPESVDAEGRLSGVGDNARFDVYLPKKPNGLMVVVCPGGGYGITSTYNEGLYAAEWLTRRGIAAAVVHYRMPKGHPGIPSRDVWNTIRYCRRHASEWGVSNIGVMGFSAGGHLAATASTLFEDEESRPDFSVLYYPVITLDEKLTHKGTRNNLLGAERNNPELLAKYSLENQVTSATPPTFLVATTTDQAVPVENSVRYFLACRNAGVDVEMHIYKTGKHGFGFNAEKYIGKGNDFFSYARPVFEKELERWLLELR